jgi:hypothetical protein
MALEHNKSIKSNPNEKRQKDKLWSIVITTRIINNIKLELKFYGLHHYLKSVQNIYVQMTTEMFRLTFHRLINKSNQTGVTNGADLFNVMEHPQSNHPSHRR